jgi:hypothetical protein
MSNETVMDMSLDTRTELSENFTCSCEILILSPYLFELPVWFLRGNTCVKVLDMSKCTQVTIIPDNFCNYTSIDHIIWPPNITSIHRKCIFGNLCTQVVDLSYCKKLRIIMTWV